MINYQLGMSMDVIAGNLEFSPSLNVPLTFLSCRGTYRTLTDR